MADSAPNGMPSDFDLSQYGLIPCHVRTSGGFIFLNLSRGEPSDFDAVVDPSCTPQNWRTVCRRIRDGAVENRRSRPLPRAGELEAGAGELSRVLSLRTGAQVSSVTAHPFGRHDACRATRQAGKATGAVHAATGTSESGTGRNGAAPPSAADSSTSGSPPDCSMANRSPPSCRQRRMYTHRQRVAEHGMGAGLHPVLRRLRGGCASHTARRHGDRCRNSSGW